MSGAKTSARSTVRVGYNGGGIGNDSGKCPILTQSGEPRTSTTAAEGDKSKQPRYDIKGGNQ